MYIQVGANLFVGNLDVDLDEKTLFDTFSSFGNVVSAKVNPYIYIYTFKYQYKHTYTRTYIYIVLYSMADRKMLEICTLSHTK